MDVKIYVMTHKLFEQKTHDEIYIPLHVGRYGKKDLGYIGDDTGDNISYKNDSFCELTGLYWMWKNSDADILGLCHYRRYFVRDSHIITESEIQDCLKGHDIIITNSAVSEISVKDHYCKKHNGSDLLREVISELYPEYLDAFDWVMNTNLTSIGNMIICRREVLHKYCSWLFDILFETERRIDISHYDTYQKRVYGFMAERLLRVWIMMQTLKVREESVIMIE
jgi:hypothetical protein